MPCKDLEKIRAANRIRSARYRAKHPERIRAARTHAPARDPEKQRIRNARYKAAHHEEHIAYNACWRANNPEKSRAQSARYRAKHPEKIRAARRLYQAANPEKERGKNARHRARKKNAPINDFTVKQWRELKHAFHYCCAYCGKKPKILEQDHITPISKGGTHTLSNIVPACRSCNAKKNAGSVLKPVQPLLLTG